MSTQNVRFPTGTGVEAYGYLRIPAAGQGPGLIVIQEWWGLTPHVASMVDRFADAGFVAFAPDLYGGTVAHDRAEAARMSTALPFGSSVALLGSAVDYLLAQPSVIGDAVGVTGFCMGGGFVLALAAARGDQVFAAAPFYGLPPEPVDYHGLTAPVLGQFATRDQAFPPARVDDELARIAEQSAAELTRIDWDSNHAFMNDENPARYDPEVAPRAFALAVDFLREHAPAETE